MLVLALVIHRLENGDAADWEGSATRDLGKGDGPDEGDLVAVPGADLDYHQGKVIGLDNVVSSGQGKEKDRELRTAVFWWATNAVLLGKIGKPVCRPATVLMLSE